jgi:hypothetical protein
VAPPGPTPPRAQDPYERLKLALAVAGALFLALFGWLLYNLALSYLDFLFSLWGILLLLGLVASGAAFVVALAMSRGRRRPPAPAHGATFDSVGTRQM